MSASARTPAPPRPFEALAGALEVVTSARTAEETLAAAEAFASMMAASAGGIDPAEISSLKALIESAAERVAESRDSIREEMCRTAERLVALRSGRKSRANQSGPHSGTLA